MRILFYLKENRLSPRGGPYGVGYYYWKEMKDRNENSIDFIGDNTSQDRIKSAGRKIASHLPEKVYKFQQIFRDIRHLKRIFKNPQPVENVDLSKYDVVQFHETLDLYMEKEQLQHYQGVVILQSHSPLPLGMEKCLSYPPIYKRLIPDIEKQFNEIDRYAFERADYLLFPCEEAEEPYMNNWNLYAGIKSKKKNSYKYVLTGINKAIPARGSEEVRKELNILPNDFVACYVGRHNEVKGYSSLKLIGTDFISKNSDNWILVAGRLGPIEAPINPKWIEIGWTTDAYSYINASDVFILPNKVTYFDLVMIEVLSLGKIVIASRTGGNKFYEKNHVPGVFLYDTENEALELLDKIKSMTKEEREKLGKDNVKFYNERLCVSSMYDSYFQVIKDIEEEIKQKGESVTLNAR